MEEENKYLRKKFDAWMYKEHRCNPYSGYLWIFKAGYLLAQKEMQEKLDAAIEVIKEIAEFECGECGDYERARDFLKARGE